MSDLNIDILEERRIDDTIIYPVPSCLTSGLHIRNKETYEELYQQSIKDPNSFWDKMGRDLISWFHPFQRSCNIDLSGDAGVPVDGHLAWFENGMLNACYNAVDRHIQAGNGERTALLYEGNEPGNSLYVTYNQLQRNVCQLSNALTRMGVTKGDVVTIYMPVSVHAVYSMLGCARIGAVTNVIFAGFSSDAIASRVADCKSRIIITASDAYRGDRHIPIFETVKEALLRTTHIRHCIVLDRGVEVKPIISTIDPEVYHSVEFHDYKKLVDTERTYCPPIWVDSEDPLFILYTSGSTGKPKGIVHTTGGYLVYATITAKYVFNLQQDDIFACLADIGWITGHTYIVYGPLSFGCTSVLFESTPLYPSPYRYWDLVQRHKITKIYTAPTAIRALMRYDESHIKNYDLSSLKVIGTVGEPINPAAWEWYWTNVGRGQCMLVDTYWMTETGGCIMSPLTGITPMKPGACAVPFFGIKPVLLDQETGRAIEGNNVRGLMAIAKPFPGMARMINGDFERLLDVYLRPHPGYFFTGDGAYRDNDGYYWIVGRVDDVINVSGHRLGTAEVESALVSHIACSESAVVGVPHALKGQAIHAFCTIKHDHVMQGDDMPYELAWHVRHMIGGIAVPEKIYIVDALPKTRSGKIMRRLLRKLAAGQFDSLGDVTTLGDSDVVDQIIDAIKSTTKPQA